jgi:hypothetical protein
MVIAFRFQYFSDLAAGLFAQGSIVSDKALQDDRLNIDIRRAVEQ